MTDLCKAHQIQPLQQHYLVRFQWYLLQQGDLRKQGVQSLDALADVSRHSIYAVFLDAIDTEDMADALLALSQAIEIQPKNVQLLQKRAVVQWRLSKHAEALLDLQTLTAIDSSWDKINVLRMCAACKDRLGQSQKALADLDRVVQLNPSHLDALLARVAIKSALRDVDGVIADMQAVVECFALVGLKKQGNGA